MFLMKNFLNCCDAYLIVKRLMVKIALKNDLEERGSLMDG